MISKASDDIALELFTDCLSAETKALESLALLAQGLGIRRGSDRIPLAGCHAYTNYLTRLAVYGSDAEILAPYLLTFLFGELITVK